MINEISQQWPKIFFLRPSLRIITWLILNLLRAGDIESNPGPRLPKYPCGECKKAGTDYRGAKASILCEECETWFHVNCVNISDQVLSSISRSDIPWECTNCGLSNISATLFESISIHSMSDCTSASSFRSSTSSCSSSEPGSPCAQSSPSKPHANSPSTCSSSVGSFRTLTINFQKLYNKREAFWSLVDATKPDIIFGCETWLNPSISQGEIFPPGYNLYRKDRKDSYGGVLMGIHDSLISHQVEVEPDVEFVAAKIISGKQNFVVGAAYRPPSSKQLYMDSINLVIESLCISNPGAAVWIGGDFNLPDIDWPTDQIIGHQYPLRLNDSFLQVLARTGLEQIVHFPTRLDNTLDLVLTNRPSLVNRCEGLPGIGDHDVVFADFNTQARRQKPVRHMIHLWKRADFNLIQSETKVWADNFVANHSSSTPVEVLSSEIEQNLEKTLKQHVPSKMTSSRFNQP